MVRCVPGLLLLLHADLVRLPTVRKRNFGGGGGSRTPVRKAIHLEDYMRIPFTRASRRRPSGTGNNEPPASLIPVAGSRPRTSGGESPGQPAKMAPLSAPRAKQKETRYLLGSESKLRVGSCIVPRRLRVVWPPACLLNAPASVETGTPPYSLDDTTPAQPPRVRARQRAVQSAGRIF